MDGEGRLFAVDRWRRPTVVGEVARKRNWNSCEELGKSVY